MTIRLQVRPEYSSDDHTVVLIEGEHEEAVMNILASRLHGADWDILIDEDYEMDE